MIYPNSNKTYKKKISHANRGMNLENLINEANKYYLDNDIAIIYKKPTPIGIVSVDEKNNNKIITKAYFKEPSTLDYQGIYKGYYIEFDAKQTLNKTSFPLSNLSQNQISHIKKIINHKGISFLIININNEYYLYSGEDLINFINCEKRKSIPYKEIIKSGYKIELNIILDYIKIVDLIIGGKNEKIQRHQK